MSKIELELVSFRICKDFGAFYRFSADIARKQIQSIEAVYVNDDDRIRCGWLLFRQRDCAQTVYVPAVFVSEYVCEFSSVADGLSVLYTEALALLFCKLYVQPVQILQKPVSRCGKLFCKLGNVRFVIVPLGELFWQLVSEDVPYERQAQMLAGVDSIFAENVKVVIVAQ